jgi:hypothetical protein
MSNKQVIPDVVDNVSDTVSFTVKYNDKELRDGQHLRPSEAEVCAVLLSFCNCASLHFEHNVKDSYIKCREKARPW